MAPEPTDLADPEAMVDVAAMSDSVQDVRPTVAPGCASQADEDLRHSRWDGERVVGPGVLVQDERHGLWFTM